MAAREWVAPAAKDGVPHLLVYNSLTRTKNVFMPIRKDKVTWYACGPTVYDDAHLGHARNYISQDVIRRVMSDYFKFPIDFVMNITDVDDKIIVAARQQYLLSKFNQKHTASSPELTQETLIAFQAYLMKNLSKVPAEVDPKEFEVAATTAYGQMLTSEAPVSGESDAKLRMHFNNARDASYALQQQSRISHDEFVAKTSAVLRPYLDSLHAASIKGDDHHIFTALTKKYERRFFDDMERLNVNPPDKLTRVTEYGPQITAFVKQIQDNGYAYSHEGSVYYDTTSWEKSGGVYARLKPENRNDTELQADGEGSLAAKTSSFKKSAADFALWKASKAGEPSWSSPWGEGRPGWHIECSAMASDVLGKQIDIHSGGIDLAFPHHDNELAQSEAYWAKTGKESQQWVNYFLHMGHLGIAGAKMSKSLKNFTTIKDALDTGLYTPRSLRIVFLLGAWRDGLEISTKPDVASETNKASQAWEEKVDNFFLKVRDLQRNPTNPKLVVTNGTSEEASELARELETSKKKVHTALSDSFDTPTAMRVISELITSYNSSSNVPDSVATDIGRWITDILVIFGLDASHKKDEIGWSGIDIPEEAKAHVYRLSETRDTIRAQAKSRSMQLEELVGQLTISDATDSPYAQAASEFRQKLLDLYQKNASPNEYLALSDHLRDTLLWNVGIYLEDRDGRPALVRPLSTSLIRERRDREARANEKAAIAEKRKAEAEAKEKERLAKGALDPQEMFKCSSEFSLWDEDGFPLLDAEGKELAKSRQKKLRKDWERQKKLHEEWQTAQK